MTPEQTQTQHNSVLQPVNPTGDYTSNSDYLRRVDHDADMNDIRTRLGALEARVGTDAAMVTTLKGVFEEDHNIDPVMNTYFESGRIDLKPAVESVVNKIDRKWVFSFLKKMGFAAWTLVIALISGGVVALWISSHK
jgi:hypothetical protein